jgi:outer membrane lipoprotein carrier protein
MRRTLLVFLAVLASLPWALLSAEEPLGPAREQLERFSDGLDSLHARFEQRVVGTDGEVQDESAGEVWLQRPSNFRWEYGGDFPELVVADGARVWIYDEVLQQVTVRNQSDAETDSPLTVLTDTGRLDEQFEVREVGQMDDMDLLELRARSQDTEFERVLLGLAGDTLRMMVMEDAFGLRTELRFQDVERNPSLDPALFRFVPPQDADVIGDLPDD